MPLRQQINQSTSTSTSKSRHIHFAVITVAATTLVFFKSYAAESQTAKLAELYSDFKKVKIEIEIAQRETLEQLEFQKIGFAHFAALLLLGTFSWVNCCNASYSPTIVGVASNSLP